VIELTPALAGRMLDICEIRRRDPRGTVYPCTVLEAALAGANLPPLPPRKFTFAASLKRPSWKHDKGSRS